jgi:hypothetical protein
MKDGTVWHLDPTAHDYDTGKACFSGRVLSLHKTPIEQELSEMATDSVSVYRSQL